MMWLCDYVFKPLSVKRTFMDKITGFQMPSVRIHVLIEADNKDLAEEKFLKYFEKRHPGRVLKAWDLHETIV